MNQQLLEEYHKTLPYYYTTFPDDKERVKFMVRNLDNWSSWFCNCNIQKLINRHLRKELPNECKKEKHSKDVWKKVFNIVFEKWDYDRMMRNQRSDMPYMTTKEFDEWWNLHKEDCMTLFKAVQTMDAQNLFEKYENEFNEEVILDVENIWEETNKLNSSEE